MGTAPSTRGLTRGSYPSPGTGVARCSTMHWRPLLMQNVQLVPRLGRSHLLRRSLFSLSHGPQKQGSQGNENLNRGSSRLTDKQCKPTGVSSAYRGFRCAPGIYHAVLVELEERGACPAFVPSGTVSPLRELLLTDGAPLLLFSGVSQDRFGQKKAYTHQNQRKQLRNLLFLPKIPRKPESIMN